ncbi:MAG: hypothetical protein OEM28_09360 [Nitrosopumilus sp.]|nr:hypothetical protein [Nitrosopumilus sp.]MDH3488489.1 hypothetical protein [Nitrosopumilus sp.]
MTQINLELFFSRRHRIATTLKKPNKDFPGIIESKPDYTESEIYEYLPPNYIKKAEIRLHLLSGSLCLRMTLGIFVERFYKKIQSF